MKKNSSAANLYYNGYVILYNGLIIQWGYAIGITSNMPAGTYEETVNFSINFLNNGHKTITIYDSPNKIYGVVAYPTISSIQIVSYLQETSINGIGIKYVTIHF